MKLDNRKLTEKLKAIIVSTIKEGMLETIDEGEDDITFKLKNNNWDLYYSVTDVSEEFSLLEISFLLNEDSGIAKAPDAFKEEYANQLNRIAMKVRGCKFRVRDNNFGIGTCHFIFKDEQLNDELFQFITNYLTVCFIDTLPALKRRGFP